MAVNKQIGWKPPIGNFVKLNTDGARKQNNKAGCGGVIRGGQGEWLGGFAKGVGDCSAFVAELWGMFEGLVYARRLGFVVVELNTDSVTVAQVISTGNLKSPVGASLLRSICWLLALDWEVKVLHVYRESNQCADALATIGCMLNKEVIYYTACPIEIRDLMLADELGITTPRIIHV